MCDCCYVFMALFSPPKNYQLERESFERTVAFLGQVPLFKKDLPASELPMVAKHLEMKTWQPGSILVKQGDMGEAFFLIQSGEVRVITIDDDQVQTERARLYTGDYFGGHTLMTRRPNVATIVASGERRLVTLSMSRMAFEQLGLKAKLVFPKRPAIYRNPRKRIEREKSTYASNTELTGLVRTDAQQKFILECIYKNPNLRALLSRNVEEMTKAMAERAERQEIKKDTIVSRCGEFGEAFYIIESGCFDVMINTGEDSGVQSAETAVANSTVAERLQRKQFFLQGLTRKSVPGEWKISKSAIAISHPSMQALQTEEVSFCASKSEKTDEKMTAVPEGDSVIPEESSQKRPQRRHSLTQGVDGLKNDMRRNSTKKYGEIVDKLNVKVGDRVAFVLPGKTEQADGIVKEICSGGLVEVIFGKESRRVDADLLRPALEPHKIARLQSGDSFGELSLIYNVRTEATFKAQEDSVVYVIRRKDFKAGFRRHGKRMEEYIALLDEVDMLTPLLKAERWELARQAYGVVEFKPHERVLTEGAPREAQLWYVIHRGHGVLYTNEDNKQKVKVERAGHFGERSLLQGDDRGEVNVDAGPEGMACLTFDGELIKQLIFSEIPKAKEQEDDPFFRQTTGECMSESLQDLFMTDAKQSINAWIAEKSKLTNVNRRIDVNLEDLKKVDLLGTGGFADVFLVVDKKHDKHYALKRMSMGFIQNLGPEVTKIVVWERDLMFKVDSPFIVHLYRTFKDSEYIYFMFEAVLGGNLMSLVRDQSELFVDDEPRGSTASFYIACLIAGLEHLHERFIVYRDMKPENVLIDELGYAKICDMGFARYVLGKTNTMCGTPEYMPPEQIDFPHTHSLSADWWSLGVLAFELLAGQPPFDDEGIADKTERLFAIRRSQENDLRFPYSSPTGLRELIRRLLRKLPQRLGAEGGAPAVRQDPWFVNRNFDFDALHRKALPAPFVPERSKRLQLRAELKDNIRDSIFEPFEPDKFKAHESSWTHCF
mmetsp:Transcript_154756/g.281339  ORF Transcript_154756/g.281339 Transcript_154756/m.281339 type:complete len:1000 (-) Transcript_154756:31-3030(-)